MFIKDLKLHSETGKQLTNLDFFFDNRNTSNDVYGVFTSIETYDNEGNMRNFWYKFRTLKRLLVLNLRTSMRRDFEFYIKILLKLSSISRCS